jgi:hypothetical protein
MPLDTGDHINVIPRRLLTAWHYQTLLLNRAEVVDGAMCDDASVALSSPGPHAPSSTINIRFFSAKDWTVQYFLERRLEATALCHRCRKPLSKHTIAYSHGRFAPGWWECSSLADMLRTLLCVIFLRIRSTFCACVPVRDRPPFLSGRVELSIQGSSSGPPVFSLSGLSSIGGVDEVAASLLAPGGDAAEPCEGAQWPLGAGVAAGSASGQGVSSVYPPLPPLMIQVPSGAASVNASLNGPSAVMALRRQSTAALAAVGGVAGVLTCSACVQCRRAVSPLRPLSHAASQCSLGKLLEVLFYNDDLVAPDPSCPHNPRLHHVRYFVRHGVVGVLRCVVGHLRSVFLLAPVFVVFFTLWPLSGMPLASFPPNTLCAGLCHCRRSALCVVPPSLSSTTGPRVPGGISFTPWGRPRLPVPSAN